MVWEKDSENEEKCQCQLSMMQTLTAQLLNYRFLLRLHFSRVLTQLDTEVHCTTSRIDSRDSI